MFKMGLFIVFDNKGQTPDRFTIINRETGDVFGASENPAGPCGIAKFCGNCADHKIVLYGAGWRQSLPPKKIIHAEVENYIGNARLNGDWLGVEVALDSLPLGVRDYIARLSLQIQTDQFSKPTVTYMNTAQENLAPGATGER
jgi:hypothetical protein